MAIPFQDSLDKGGVASVFGLMLLHAVTNVHLLHWQSKSYAQHVTLGELYEALDDGADAYLEAYMGKYGQINNVPEFYKSPNPDPIAYVEALVDHIAKIRKDLPDDSELQQLIDNLVDSCDSALYKLRFLK